jgi:hypothetical protein
MPRGTDVLCLFVVGVLAVGGVIMGIQELTGALDQAPCGWHETAVGWVRDCGRTR